MLGNSIAEGFTDDIEPDAFAGSAFEQLPFVNGVKMANNIVIDIDKTAGEVIIPDADCRKAIFLPGVNLSGIKKLIVHRYSTAMQVGSDTGVYLKYSFLIQTKRCRGKR